jgi:O-glycosyl hydrolase
VKLRFLPHLLLASVCVLNSQTVSVWLTTDDQKTLLQPQAAVSFSTGGSATIPTVFIDELQRYQTIEGFGASFTDSSAWLMNNKIVPASSLPTVMNSLFDHTAGIGISFVRNPMGASDLARSLYSYDDMPAGATDPNLSSFSIAHDEADIIPLIRQAKLINPHLKLMANPWSPPGWMKTSGSMIGGSLLPANYTSLRIISSGTCRPMQLRVRQWTTSACRTNRSIFRLPIPECRCRPPTSSPFFGIMCSRR